MAYKLSYEYIKKCFEDKGYILISKEYVNSRTPLQFICSKHKEAGIQHITWTKFNLGRGCRPCKGFRVLNIDIIKKEFEDRNYTLISTKYQNNHEHLYFRCNDHSKIGIQSVRYGNFKFGCGCSECGRINKSIKNTKDNDVFICELNEVSDFKFAFLSKYIHEDKKIKLKCNKCGHEFERTPRVLLNGSIGCPKCDKIIGEKSALWKGGLSPYSSLFRSGIKDVFDKPSFKYFGYKCVITDSKSPTVHHLYGFNKILEETLSDLRIDFKNHRSDYTNDEIILIQEKLNENHLKYGIGVPISTKIHKLFHLIYGKGNNTHLQFATFLKDLIDGKYDNYLQENDIVLKINSKLIDFIKPYMLKIA